MKTNSKASIDSASSVSTFNYVSTMKTSLKLIALILAAATPCIAFAEFAGVSIPAALSGEVLFSAFASVGVLLIGVADYGRPRPITMPSLGVVIRPAVVPAPRRRSAGGIDRRARCAA
ncbi:MAG: hypothetical protein A3G75_11170 [Verrucomicrobia bacterium RIFCSPLOWO2_12_FULL_64_8]|nr:MAG: hypothetical protein A3G75_11170 [Verrucomicrobia bacterium RIFCSPLOWO2_12_FULL_64_8]